MPEVKQKMATFYVEMICDKCGTGKMVPTGLAIECFPPRYPHVCNNQTCKNLEVYSDCYPKIRHEIIEKEEDDAAPEPMQVSDTKDIIARLREFPLFVSMDGSHWLKARNDKEPLCLEAANVLDKLLGLLHMAHETLAFYANEQFYSKPGLHAPGYPAHRIISTPILYSPAEMAHEARRMWEFIMDFYKANNLVVRAGQFGKFQILELAEYERLVKAVDSNIWQVFDWDNPPVSTDPSRAYLLRWPDGSLDVGYVTTSNGGWRWSYSRFDDQGQTPNHPSHYCLAEKRD